MKNALERILSNYSVNAMAFKTACYFNTFRKTYAFLKRSQWWEKEKIEAYQLAQLKKLLLHASAHVPYYKKIFTERKISPTEITSLNDIQQLPFLTKELVREHVEELKATNYPEHKFEYARTGGSTGFPLQFYKEKGAWMARHTAYTKITMDWADCSLFDRYVFITGRDEPWKYQLFGRVLVLSSFYMNDQYLPALVEKIRKLKPRYILTYPSAITILAQYMKKKKLGIFPSVKTIICHAETLYDWQRTLVEETFCCRVNDSYGLREQVAFGATCEYSNYFHMLPQYSVIELIGKNGKPVNKEGEIGEIVGTGFHTHIFPLIRYKTGDIGVYTKEKCECGRNFPLLKKIEGRVQDFVISKTNQIVPFTRFQHLVAESTDHVTECQFYQDSKGEIVLNLIKTQEYAEADSQVIKKNFQKALGNEFDLSICFVDTISRSNRGKFQFLIQKLPLDYVS